MQKNIQSPGSFCIKTGQLKVKSDIKMKSRQDGSRNGCALTETIPMACAE
jgi:hypothetical protein